MALVPGSEVQPGNDNQARLTYLKRELLKSVTHSRHFKVRTCTYDPPKRAIPERVKKLLREIDELEGKHDQNTEHVAITRGTPKPP